MKYNYLVLFSAFILAACGALVSIFGLGQLFAGAGIIVKVMVGGIEFGKLVLAAALHRYWGKLHSLLKFPLAFIVVIMMGLTSLGIYGFLSDGYQQTASQYEIESGKTELLSNKAARFTDRIAENDKLIESKNKRSATLSSLRAQQEVRLDSLYAKNYITNANKVRQDIDAATKEIQILSDDIDDILVKNSALADSVGVYKERIGEVMEASEVTSELGPLIYLSNLTGLEMAVVVNILIFLIMGVFDPTAVGLLILASSILKIEEDNKPTLIMKQPNKSSKSFIERVKGAFKGIKLPKATIPPNETDEEPKNYKLFEIKDEFKGEPLIDDRVDRVEIPLATKVEAKLVPNEDYKAPVKEGGIVARGKIGPEDLDVIRNNEKKKSRGYSVDVPVPKVEPTITKAPEPTVLGKTWSKKKT